MNILVLTNIYPNDLDKNPDRTKVISFFAQQWLKMGHNVFVIVNSAAFPSMYYKIGSKFSKLILKNTRLSQLPNIMWKEEFIYFDGEIQVKNLPMKKIIPQGKYSNKVINLQVKRIVEYLNDYKFLPDVILGHWLNPQLILVSKLKRIYNVPNSFVFHSDYSENKYRKYNVQKYLKNIDHVGFRSLSSLEAASNYMIFNNPPFICTSGIPNEFVLKYANIGRKKEFFKNKLSIICVGRLVEYKQIDKILEAISLSTFKESISLTIVGEGPLKNDLLDKKNKLDLNNVIFIDRVEREKLQDMIWNSDVFCLISVKEVFGLVYLEALLQGSIVIASKFGAMDGIIKNGENGFLCEEGNSSELVKILDSIFCLPLEKKEKISSLAIQTAKKYTDYNIALQYINLITDFKE